jgi:tetratricopeptide (TPR) repeat protein
MMRWCLALCVLFCLLVPGFLSAQDRWLRGKVVTIDEHEQKKPEVNLTVTMLATGDADNTNSMGLFRIFLKNIFKPGEKVTLVIDKPGWRIRYPLDGEARIPADLGKEVVEVQLLPVGSKLFWTDDRIEKFIRDVAEKAKQQVTPAGRPETIDFGRYIKDWAIKYGFSAEQAKEEIDKWITEIEANQNDLYNLGLAAFAKKNFGEASQLFNESAEHKAKKLEEVRRRERSLAEEVVRDFRLAGEAHYSNYVFDKALNAYQRAITYVSRQQTPQLWAAILIDIGRAYDELGIRSEGLAIERYLSAAVKAYHQALEVQTREQLPQDWAMTQNNLGAVLREQGTRTGGEAGTRLLAEAVTAYRQALEVFSREILPLQWAQTHNNLARTYIYLEDWANAAASYANVLTVYPDGKETYYVASQLYHEKLLEFPQAYALNQQWLERHPDDLAALSDFAEKHFTTGRFAECEERIAALLATPAVEPRVHIALRAIQIANSLAFDKIDLVPRSIDALIESIANQPEDFKVKWSFKGTRHFISNNERLAPHRPWLMQLFDAVEGADRHAILSALQEALASFPAVVKQ